jgi:hypothetical protein
MNRLTVLTDIASRTMLSTLGSPKTVAGAVTVDTARMNGIRAEVATLPKWANCTADDAALAVDLLVSQAVAISVVSFNRETESWKTFIADSEVFHEAIILTSKKVAGWAKPANLLKFILIGSACAVATGHALGSDRSPRIVGASGRKLIDCSTVCDEEVEGAENRDVFKSLWSMQRIPTSRLAKAGFEFVTNDVKLTTEQLEPGLLLADYADGLGLSALTPEPGRLRLPLDHLTARELLGKLKEVGKLVVVEEDFPYSYDEIFKDVMDRARELADAS